MHFADLPRFVPVETYERVLSEVTRLIMAQPGALTVYQVGGVGTPGISDLDLYAVFADGASVSLDPRAGLDTDGRYVVTHGQFGLCRSHFAAAGRYGFFHNFRLLAGPELAADPVALPLAELETSKVQESLEYLVKMWVWLTVGRRYGIVRLRSLMLLVKGLLHDLHHVGVDDGPLVDAIHRMLAWRQDWFQRRPADAELERWVDDFAAHLELQLNAAFVHRPLYVPDWGTLRIARNMRLERGSPVAARHVGLPVPAFIARRSRRTYNLQHRLNHFRFRVPITAAGMPAVVAERHRLIGTMVAYNSTHLPHFTPVTYGLAIYDGNPPP